jgi:Protein of unknown function (DUF429)
MLSVGIDLSASDGKTSACGITWDVGRGSATVPEVGLSDRDILEHRRGRLGCHRRAVRLAGRVHRGGRRLRRGGRFPTTARKRLRYRETDRFVEERARLPLSVSSDRIAVTAMRCASILTMLGAAGEPVDRAGSGRVLEVYPAAALAVWGIDPEGYKTRDKAAGVRRRILAELADGAGGSPELSADVAQRCTSSDDALDALISALLARAADRGLTIEAPPELRDQASREGWIHLPVEVEGSLAALAG